MTYDIMEFVPDESKDFNTYMQLSDLLEQAWGEGGLTSDIVKHFDSNDHRQQVVQLIRLGDHVALSHDGTSIDLWTCYELAVRTHLDGVVQLAVACALINRADPTAAPLCEQDYIEDEAWTPLKHIHDQVRYGPDVVKAPDRERMIRLALEAYGNAWSFLSMSSYHREKLVSLDGIRVCYEELGSSAELWSLCESWSAFFTYSLGSASAIDSFDAEAKSRFAQTRGRLEATFEGRGEAQKRLERELGHVWDRLHQSAREHLITAEYKRALLRDPRHDPWDYVDKYSLAVEAMLDNRLGYPLDQYLDGVDTESVRRFKKDHLRGGSLTAHELTYEQWQRALADGRTLEILSEAGLDHKYVFSGLLSDLKKLHPYRGPAHHHTDKKISPKEIDKARSLTLKILGNLGKIRWTAPEVASDDS